MEINIDTIKTYSMNLLLGTYSIATGIFLGREIYQVGIKDFYKRVPQNSTIQFCVTLMISMLPIATICIIASKVFSEQHLRLVTITSLVSGFVMGRLISKSLNQAAAAGHQLPAYIITALAASFAVISLLIGLERFINANKPLLTNNTLFANNEN